MGLPQVSHQALLNEAARHKTWESLEKRLMDLIVSGQVLSYEHQGDKIEVVLDGTTKPVYLAVNPNSAKPKEKTEEIVFEPAPEAQRPAGAVAVKERPKAAKPLPAAAPVKITRVLAPLGVVALVGQRTETYEAHVRRLVQHALKCNYHMGNKMDDAVEMTLQSFWNPK